MSDTTTGAAEEPYGGSVASLATAITEALADDQDADPLTGPPLHDYVDLEAVHALFQPGSDGSGARPRSVSVAFRVEDHAVRVTHDGTIDVTPLDGTARSQDAVTGHETPPNLERDPTQSDAHERAQPGRVDD